jgi:carbon storage regulator
MLVLCRRIDQSIQIGDDIQIVVLNASKNRVRLGIAAPKELVVMRPEATKRRSIEPESCFAAAPPHCCVE